MRNLESLSEEDRTLVEEYVLGELSPETATTVERRLRTDTALRQELCALQATLRLLPHAQPMLEPPPGLRDRILATHTLRNKILTTPPSVQMPPEVAPLRPDSERDLPLSMLLAGLAAVLALLLGMDNLRLRYALNQTNPDSATNVANLLQQPTSRLVALQGETGQAANAAGTLLFTPGQWQQVVVSLGNLPALPPEEIYRMWLTLENGQVIFCGEFNTDDQGNVFVELQPDEDVPPGVKATGIFVTVESASATPQPTSQRVMTGRI
jgi:hypothetical protein